MIAHASLDFKFMIKVKLLFSIFVLRQNIKIKFSFKILIVLKQLSRSLVHKCFSNKSMRTTKYLVERPEMEVNAVNGNGFTALDIIQHMPRDLKEMEIRESLVKAGALSSRNLPRYQA